ncbi:FeoA domain protein [Corynebacterium gerontici]|uniref:FeoA domain protein n=2 Tax=Corynebacterium gerontici TaxID=2079234 RepID=A0A3G6J2N7_9CORY|nr:FeoA domain protein [Corynebacterium gerontici]
MFGALANSIQRRLTDPAPTCAPGSKTCQECHGEPETFALCNVPCGNSCKISRISEINLSPTTQRRLAELGLRAGMKVTVTQKISSGGRVLKIGTTRYAIDGNTASELLVTAA